MEELLARPEVVETTLAGAIAADDAAHPALDAATAAAAAEGRLAASHGTMAPSARQAWTGRVGERTAVMLLQQWYSGRTPPVSVRWVNEAEETHLPYDIVVEVPQADGSAPELLLQVEVKTTARNGRTTELSLPVSLKELQHHYMEPRHTFLVIWGVQPGMQASDLGILPLRRINAALPDATVALMLVCDATRRSASAAAALVVEDGEAAEEA